MKSDLEFFSVFAEKSGTIKLCSECFLPIYQGCSHECGVKEGLQNITKLLGPDKMEKLCHQYIKEKANQSGSGDNLITLAGCSGGKPLNVKVSPKSVKPKKVFKLQHTIAMRSEGNFTSKYVLSI